MVRHTLKILQCVGPFLNINYPQKFGGFFLKNTPDAILVTLKEFHFMPKLHFYTPGFLTFSRGMDMKH